MGSPSGLGGAAGRIQDPAEGSACIVEAMVPSTSTSNTNSAAANASGSSSGGSGRIGVGGGPWMQLCMARLMTDQEGISASLLDLQSMRLRP